MCFILVETLEIKSKTVRKDFAPEEGKGKDEANIIHYEAHVGSGYKVRLSTWKKKQ